MYAGVRLGVSQVRLGSSGVRHRGHAPGTALFPLAFPLMEKIKHTDEEPSKGTRIYEKIKEHNADEVNGFEYTWNITKENSENKPIILQMYSDKYVFNYDGKFWEKLLKIITIVAIIVVGVIATIVIVRSKMKNANKI